MELEPTGQRPVVRRIHPVSAKDQVVLHIQPQHQLFAPQVFHAKPERQCKPRMVDRQVRVIVEMKPAKPQSQRWRTAATVNRPRDSRAG